MKTYYVGMDVHLATIVIEVLNGAGKVVMETIVPTGAEGIRGVLKQLRGRVYVTFEEGTQASWLYQLIKPLVTEVMVCDPRHNKLLQSGNKGDRVDARKLAELLRQGSLREVYHEDEGVRTLKELVRNYDCLVSDTTRVKNRLKALYRGRAIKCGGNEVYRTTQREQWVGQLVDGGARRRAESLYTQLEGLQQLRRAAKREMLREARRHPAFKLLTSVTQLGAVSVAELLAVVVTPFRFRSKRQFWSYVGLAVVTHTSADYVLVNGLVRRTTRPVATRGLNRNHNHRLKKIFKQAANSASKRGPLAAAYEQRVARGMSPNLARLTIARRLAAITLAVWKTGQVFAADRVSPAAQVRVPANDEPES